VEKFRALLGRRNPEPLQRILAEAELAGILVEDGS
jgi:hypothetical protein